MNRLGVGQVLAHRFPGVAVDDRLPRGCDAVEDLAVVHRQPGDGWPQQHLAHLAALPQVALGSLEPLGIPVFGDAPQGGAVEQRVAGFADRRSLFGHDGVAVVAETPLHPRLPVLGAFWLAAFCRTDFCSTSYLATVPFMRANIRPLGVDRSTSPPTLASSTPWCSARSMKSSQLAGLAVQPVHVPDGERV